MAQDLPTLKEVFSSLCQSSIYGFDSGSAYLFPVDRYVLATSVSGDPLSHRFSHDFVWGGPLQVVVVEVMFS